MPPLARPECLHTVRLPPREANLLAETDVLVVGGGPAGLAAAIGAAGAGSRVILAEQYGFLGGNATAALVITMVSFYTQKPAEQKPPGVLLFPTDSIGIEPVVGGVLTKFLERLVRAGGAISPSTRTGFIVPFDPEVFKTVALDMLDEAGIQFLLHAFASGVIGDSNVEGVVFETKSGPVLIRARIIIDCTGDGDIAAQAGLPYEIGRQEDGLVQPMSLLFTMSGFNRQEFAAYVEKYPDQWRGVQGLGELVRQATGEGKLDLPREDILFFGAVRDDMVSVNSTRILKVLGTDVLDLTFAEWAGRRQMRQIAEFLKSYVPGFSQAYLAQSGATVCVRETRRIKGQYVITGEDILQARRFGDVIALGSYPVDMHNPAGKGTILKRLPPGESYDIPLRSLLPEKEINLVVAGRCISGTHEAQSSYRASPTCFATGHAAGVCAALAARRGLLPHAIAIGDIQSELVRQGANLRGIR